jgi:hypothetical protein
VTDSHLVKEADQALASVSAIVEQQANEIATINQIAIQQLDSSNAIVQIMQNVSASTQQSSTTIHEISQTMQHISLLSEKIDNSVHMFKGRDSRTSQVAGQLHHSSLGLRRIDRVGLNSAQQASIGPTTQPLHHEPPLPTTQLNSSPSTPYPPSSLSTNPLSPIPIIPAQPQIQENN